MYSALWWRLLEVDEDSPLSLSAVAAAVQVMRAGIGTQLMWDDHEFVVIAVDYRHALLRSLTEEFVREVVIEELLGMPDVVWRDLRPPSTEPTDLQLIAGLPQTERRIVEVWVEQLELVKRAVDAGMT